MEEIRALAGHAPVEYQVEIDGVPVSVRVTSDATLDIGGRSFHADVSAIEGLSNYSLLLDNASYEVVIEERDGTYYATIRGKVHRIKVRDWATSAPPPSGANATCVGETVVRAPMCGLVVEVLVSVGQAVEASQAIVTLESMKMENEIRSPRAGTVREVRVKAGAMVTNGDVLAVVG